MSNSAFKFFSTKWDYFEEEIMAIDIKSREDARSLGPFFNENKKLMCWVNWGKKKDGSHKHKPYFRNYSELNYNSKRQIREKIQREQSEIDELKKSDIHKKTQVTLKCALERLIKNNESLPWYFDNQRLTDFPLSGDFLSEVTAIEKEFVIKPLFIDSYRLDIALLGNKICNKQIILGAVEIEYSNEVELLKTLLCKALGFPLFTINIKDVRYEEITEEWCIKRLTETTSNSGDKRRRNYAYIHNMLYPVFLSEYEGWDVGEKHQYIIFAKQNDYEKLKKLISKLKETLCLNDQDVNLMPVKKNSKNQGSITLFQNEGALVGNWENYNSEEFIRLILKRPKKKSGNIYKFHLVLTQLLALHFDCLVGYKYDIEKSNFDKDRHIWEITKTERNPNPPPNFIFNRKNFCPKRLSEPIREIMKYIP